MKRLIYAAVVFVLLLSLTLCSHVAVDHYCESTIKDVKNFYKQKISGDTLSNSWIEHKEKMSAFVNHEFLDQISIYIGQITLDTGNKDEKFSVAYKNIETLLEMIKEEQRLKLHSFY